jgi:hypothetical protein
MSNSQSVKRPYERTNIKEQQKIVEIIKRSEAIIINTKII